jgi:hypothetical protein
MTPVHRVLAILALSAPLFAQYGGPALLEYLEEIIPEPSLVPADRIDVLLGFARIEGSAAGTRLTYEWTLPPDKGRGVVSLRDNVFEGSWGMGTANAGGGTVSFARQH